jgi:ABC-type nitrate/sulfonate/bicarbonate transport system substrate-binding protein
MKRQALAGILGGSLLALSAACAATTAAPASPAAAGGSSAAAPSDVGASAPAPAAQPVRLGLIAPLSGYWAVYAADALGYFTREGVTLDQTLTGSPSQSAQLLASGDLDLAINTPDTAIIAITKGADFAIVASAQSEALFGLIGAPGIQSFDELRGKALALNNSPRDGIAAMTRRTLEANGVREDEVDLVMVGGTPQRYTALKSGVVAAALLTQPQDIMAMAEGMKRLALVADVVGEWQNLSVIANHGWARSHDELLVRWLRGYVAACRWLQDPANRAEAVRILTPVLQVPEEIAQRTWALYFEERAGHAWTEDCGVRAGGVRNVIALNEELGAFDGPPPTVDRVLDTSFWERARQ